MRPNPNFFRGAIMKITDIQTLRALSEEEVRQINFIIKSRAYRYVGAAKEEWLYPEEHVSKSDWYKYGYGYLLMPDPRAVSYSTGVLIGHRDGTATSFDEYGRRPWQQDESFSRKGTGRDWDTFQRFKGEFARLFGPYRRGRAASFPPDIDNERDDDEYHKHHLRLEEEYRKKIKRRQKK